METPATKLETVRFVGRLALVTCTLGEKHLCELVHDLCGQTFKEFLWIVVDGSNEESLVMDCLNQASSHTIDCAHLRAEPQGIANALNIGMREAILQGCEWIAVLHSTERLTSPSSIQILNAVVSLDTRRCVHAFPSIKFIETDNSIKCIGRYGVNTSTGYIPRNSLPHPLMTCHASTLVLNGYYSEDYKCSLDYEWILRLWKRGVIFNYHPLITLTYFRSGGMSSRARRVMIRERCQARRLYLSKLEAFHLNAYDHISSSLLGIAKSIVIAFISRIPGSHIK